MSFPILFDSAYEYATGYVLFSETWTANLYSSSALIQTHIPKPEKVMYSKNPVSGERFIFIPTDLGNVVIEERKYFTAKTVIHIAHMPDVIAKLLGVVSGSPITTADQFRLFFDPLFKTTIHNRLTALKLAFQALEVETTT